MFKLRKSYFLYEFFHFLGFLEAVKDPRASQVQRVPRASWMLVIPGGCYGSWGCSGSSGSSGLLRFLGFLPLSLCSPSVNEWAIRSKFLVLNEGYKPIEQLQSMSAVCCNLATAQPSSI